MPTGYTLIPQMFKFLLLILLPRKLTVAHSSQQNNRQAYVSTAWGFKKVCLPLGMCHYNQHSCLKENYFGKLVWGMKIDFSK